MNTTLSVIVNQELIYYNKHTNYVVILDYLLKMFQIRTIWIIWCLIIHHCFEYLIT